MTPLGVVSIHLIKFLFFGGKKFLPVKCLLLLFFSEKKSGGINSNTYAHHHHQRSNLVLGGYEVLRPPISKYSAPAASKPRKDYRTKPSDCVDLKLDAGATWGRSRASCDG